MFHDGEQEQPLVEMSWHVVSVARTNWWYRDGDMSLGFLECCHEDSLESFILSIHQYVRRQMINTD